MRVIWIVALAAACQPRLLSPEALEGAEGRSLFATDSAAARSLAERLATEHVEAHEGRLLAGLSPAQRGMATRGVRIAQGKAHVRLDQTLDGVPVFGAQAIVHLASDGEVSDVTDRWARDLVVDTVPRITAGDAIALAERREGPSLESPDADLFVLRHRGRDHLVWRVQLQQLDGTARSAMPVVFVDAHTEEVVRRYDNLQTASTGHASTAYNGDISFPVDQISGRWHLRSSDDGVGTYDLLGGTPSWISSSSLTDVTSGSVDGFGDEVAVDAHFGAVQTHAYYAAMHGRDGIDGSGGPNLSDGVTVSAVHYGEGYANAFWNGSAMVYGDGDGWNAGPLTSLDIAAHEMTHGVTQHTAGLIYDGESGALNEAMSDIFAALVEQYVEGDGPDRWKIGEDCWTPNTAGDALRDMSNPTVDYASRDHYDTRYTGLSDNGGVHWNSGIANLAFHLLVEGGVHPNPTHRVVTVQGIGWDKAGAIFYGALTEHMTPSTDFFGARAATIAAAEGLYGAGSAEADAVADAWAEVGVGSPAGGDTTPVEPPPEPGELVSALDLLLSGDKGETQPFAIEVPEGATMLTVRLTGGSGDADLYLRHGEAPTDTVFDCRPYQGGNEELCEVEAPAAGVWHVQVRGYLPFTDVQLLGEVTAPEGPAPEQGLDEVVAGAKGEEALFSIDVPEGASTLTVTLSGGTGDADLYVNQGATVSQNDWDCRPYKGGNEESCVMSAPAAGPWSVLLHGWSDYAGATLTATVE